MSLHYSTATCFLPDEPDETTISLDFYDMLLNYLSNDDIKVFEDLINYLYGITFGDPLSKKSGRDEIKYERNSIVAFFNGLKPYIVKYLKDGEYNIETLAGYYYDYISDCERDIEEYKSKLEETEKKMNTFKEKLDALGDY